MDSPKRRLDKKNPRSFGEIKPRPTWMAQIYGKSRLRYLYAHSEASLWELWKPSELKFVHEKQKPSQIWKEEPICTQGWKESAWKNLGIRTLF